MRRATSRDAKGRILTPVERRMALWKAMRRPSFAGDWHSTDTIIKNLDPRLYGSYSKPRDVLLDDLKKLLGEKGKMERSAGKPVDLWRAL